MLRARPWFLDSGHAALPTHTAELRGFVALPKGPPTQECLRPMVHSSHRGQALTDSSSSAPTASLHRAKTAALTACTSRARLPANL